MTLIEKEIKVSITDISKLVLQLKRHHAVIIGLTKEKTFRYDTPDQNLAKSGLFLRLRSGFRNVITLKEKKQKDKKYKVRVETELEIGDLKNMSYILKRTGLSHIKIMEKYRINFKYKHTILSLDELPFGIFLEIEGPIAKIKSVMKDFGFDSGEVILDTYWALFIKTKQKHSKSDDIIFPPGYKSQLFKYFKTNEY